MTVYFEGCHNKIGFIQYRSKQRDWVACCRVQRNSQSAKYELNLNMQKVEGFSLIFWDISIQGFININVFWPKCYKILVAFLRIWKNVTRFTSINISRRIMFEMRLISVYLLAMSGRRMMGLLWLTRANNFSSWWALWWNLSVVWLMKIREQSVQE